MRSSAKKCAACFVQDASNQEQLFRLILESGRSVAAAQFGGHPPEGMFWEHWHVMRRASPAGDPALDGPELADLHPNIDDVPFPWEH
jgi:hypothetical protein